MKKRLIAWALTLAMVLSSFAVLSFVSFGAEENVATVADSTREKLYAYMGTNKIDGAIDADEPFTVRVTKLLPKVSMSVTWDYDNVYIYIYQQPFGVGDYLKTLSVNIGGAELKINDWVQNDYSAPEGAKINSAENAPTLSDGTTASYSVGTIAEFSIPLSEMTLDSEALADGVLSMPMTLSLGAVADGANTVVNKEYDLILSGRSISARTINVNGSNPDTNGYAGFSSTASYSDDAGASVSEGITRNGTNHGTFTVIDANPSAERIRVFGMMPNVTEYISCEQGFSNHISLEMNIKNLPIYGDVTKNDNVNEYNNTAATIAVYGGGRNGLNQGSGIRAHIYNSASGLMIAYYDGTDTPAVTALGVGENETFRLGFNELAGGNIEILVNEEVIADDAKAMGNPASSMVGYFWVSSKRGSQYGYSLDMDSNGTISAEEQISFTVTNFTLCALNDVDVKTVASKTKQGGAASVFAINAPNASALGKDVTANNSLSLSGNAGNVASMAKAYATYSTKDEMLYLTLTNANVDKFDIVVGGAKMTVTYAKGERELSETVKVATLTPTLETSVTGATVTMDSIFSKTLIAIPLNQIDASVQQRSVVANIAIKATREYQIIRNAGLENEQKRAASSYVGNVTGTVILENATEKSVVLPTVASMSSAAGSSIGGAGTVTYTKSDVARNVSACGGQIYTKANTRVATFDFTPTAMQAYAKSTIKADSITGVSATASPQDRVRFIIDGCIIDGTAVSDKASIAFTVTNTTDGGSDGGESLVIVFTDKTGVTVVPLDKKVGDTVSFKMVWNPDNSGAIYADGKALIAVDDIRCITGANLVTGGNTGMFVVETYRPDTSSAADFAHTVTNIKLSTYIDDFSLIDCFKNKGEGVDYPIDLEFVQESKPVDGKFDVRFTSSIDSLEYGYAGHEISIFGANNTVSKQSHIVYKRILANTENGIEAIDAEEGKYFVTLNVGNLPVQAETITFVIRPYVTVENVKYYGQGYTVKYSNGEFAGSSLYNGVITVLGDSDPFYDDSDVITDNVFVSLDENFNSLVYDMGKVTNINRAKLTTMNDAISFFNKSFAGVYYSKDGKTYNYLSNYSVFQNGNEVYLYNFNVEARYLKINTTKDIAYHGEGEIENYSQYMFVAEYSDMPLLSNDDFSMVKTVNVTNNTAEKLYDQVKEFTLASLGISASDLKADMSDIRFMCDGMSLPHYYSNGTFYVRIFELDPYDTETITVRYNSDTAIDVSNGDETFEIQYGNKYITEYHATPWQNSVATMPNGDVLKMGFRANGLVMNRSTDGGATWSGYEGIPGTEVVTHGGGFLVDNKNGIVFYMSLEYYGDKDTADGYEDSICEYMIFKSTDSGYTWTGPIEVSGFTPPTGSATGRYYAISYSDGIALTQADGTGPNIDYVFSTGRMIDKACNFCTTAFYSKDGGATWQASTTKINYTPDKSGVEMGLSEEALFEQPDGTLVIYARCQMTDGVHFAISRSTDHGVTWSQPTSSDGTAWSNIYTTNTQPIIEKLNGNPVLMWGGNNTKGGTSYSRFPMNLATTDDNGNTFVDIIDLGFQTKMGILDNYLGNYDHYAHTNPDLTFYNYGGTDSLYLVTCDFEMYVRDIENLLLKTKGAYDSFESGIVRDHSFVEKDSKTGADVTRNHFDCDDGWVTSSTTSSFTIGTLGATDGKYALNIAKDSVVSRALHYMEKGKISFDYYVSDFGTTDTQIELQSGFNNAKNAGATPITLIITSDGSLKCYIVNKYSGIAALTDTGINLNKGNNTITVEFDGNAATASVTVNGTKKDIAYRGEASGTTYGISPANFISYIVVHNGTGVTGIDRFTAIKYDTNLPSTSESITSFTVSSGATVSSGTITYSDPLTATPNRDYAIGYSNSLKYYGNTNVIDFNINVQSMVGLDESYLRPEQSTKQWNWHVSDDVTYRAPRIVIGATRPADGKLDYEDAMCLAICNISGKGLCVVATYCDGNTVSYKYAPLGKGTGTQFKMTVVWEANYGDLHVCVDGVKVATFEDYKYVSGTDYGMFAGNPGVLSINFCRQVASGVQFKATISGVKVTQY